MVAALALGAVGTARPETSATPLAKKLARSLTLPQLRSTRVGAIAVDLRTGEAVFTRQVARGLVPASVEKLVVTYAALVTLGPSYRFRTELLARGSQDGATWRGDLVLKGYGDPTLSRGDLRRLARVVRGAGIRAIAGRILGDESYFDSRRTAPGWRPRFYLNECPALSALVVDRAAYRGRLTRWPAAAAAAVLKQELDRAGVDVRGRAISTRRPAAPAAAQRVASVSSPPLWKVLRFMGRESDNFTAELVLKQLGALYGRSGTTTAGAGVVRRLLAADGISLAGVRIADGSGLSRRDRLTPRALTDLLAAAWASPQLRKAFVTTLPVAGRTGTLDRRLTRPPARGNVVAKTGTTLVSSSLAGYVRGRYAFAVLHNASPVPSWWARVAQDRFVTALARAP
jgi:D-alanyl-D-alanine carboxypeptidase/D-alanyl-D-alanine-endopeptidase (penicillin-binding protein 4)